ncbi:recombinase family protein [Sedimentibacter hydroxybenzoicus DSM 7310]|uniref:Recombinase family protein n=1 Tax=Sedimentibacter hydroxybenzoicus DSM 7310 TaxID=1123245 RepID=A0A974GW79_SEDHY|nr:recombinase family protein [Sedimentibacter hydroxybenzoicus]NYB73780.1 recombinase family protein [Sedimentibacter hydroxybenzoicus DSM 7310]
MKKRCYIYTRVSTEMQVDGYSLDAQKEKLTKYAEYQEMVIMGEYSDAGSGKNLSGRPDFLRMLTDIEQGKDKVDFVLVFKLSRFGRNAADVLSSLQLMQDYGVNLVCTEDGIDSSKDSGKLMISVLSAVAEIERENILVQTMAGRREKARVGEWNGGFAPYGYDLIDGKLTIAEEEAKVIEIIYKQFTTTNMGINAVASYLNNNGYKKKKRQNGTLDAFSASFVKSILDNPVYMGKIAYGRRKNEKIQGERNRFHIVKQSEYPVYDGVHKAIVSEEIWNTAQAKRKQTGFKYEKKYSLDHANILSGILKCPSCGAAMYGNVNRKKKEDGTYYRDYFYYACKHRMRINGHQCDYKKQWGQAKIDDAVAEVIMGLVKNPKFEQAIRDKINSKIDTQELELELESLRKSHRQAEMAKSKLEQQIDTLDITDSLYDRKYEDMQNRLYQLYERIDSIEIEIEEIKTRIQNINLDKLNADSIYNILRVFDQLYDKFTDFERQEFIKSFVEKIEIYPETQEDGRILKNIKFRFPVFFNGSEVNEISWDSESTVECVILMQRCGIEGKS